MLIWPISVLWENRGGSCGRGSDVTTARSVCWLENNGGSRRTTPKAFLDRNVFSLLSRPTAVRVWMSSWLSSLTLVLIGCSEPVIDGDRRMIRPITCQVFFFKKPDKKVSSGIKLQGIRGNNLSCDNRLISCYLWKTTFVIPRLRHK